MPRHPELLGISEDEGTVWVVRGDVAEIIGRDKAFVYGGRDSTDTGKALSYPASGGQTAIWRRGTSSIAR